MHIAPGEAARLSGRSTTPAIIPLPVPSSGALVKPIATLLVENLMRSRSILFLVLIASTLSGCDAIASIFRAGFWVGIIAVLVVLGLIGLVVSRTRR
jgi:hypothetical protein